MQRLLCCNKIKMKNKKAQLQIPGAIVDFYAIVAFVLVIMIFALLFFIRSCTSDNEINVAIQGRVQDIDSNIILLNYLRTPVTVDEKNMSITDLITLRLYDGKYDAQLKSESEKILTPFYEAPYFWGIVVYDEEEDDILTYWQQEYASTIEYDEVQKAKQPIPYPNVNGYYTIELIKWED